MSTGDKRKRKDELEKNTGWELGEEANIKEVRETKMRMETEA